MAKFVEHQGRLMTLHEYSEVTGIAYRTIVHRYDRGDRGEMLARPIDKRQSRAKAEKAPVCLNSLLFRWKRYA